MKAHRNQLVWWAAMVVCLPIAACKKDNPAEPEENIQGLMFLLSAFGRC